MKQIYLLMSTLGILLCHISIGQSISLTGAAYTQNFSSLANSGTSTTLPNGWYFTESGTNANTVYTAGTGSGTAGDTYSFGSSGSIDRAFGGLQSGSLIPTIGASFTNNTGTTLTSLTIFFIGEQWRLGTANRGSDRLDFQYSLNATALNNGTWTHVDELDFVGPINTGALGALDGNAAANRANVSYTLTGLSIPNGTSFFIRWTDFNASGADDGLAIDTFSVETTIVVTKEVTVEGGINAQEPATNGSFNITLSSVAPAGGVTIGYSLAGTAGSSDYGTAQTGSITIPAGSSTGTITIHTSDDLLIEGTESISINLLSASNGYSITTGTASISLFDNEGSVGNTYTFNGCITSLPEGFSEYSVTGPQKWTCTTFGNNSTRGVNMNGFSGGANFNEDWLISPAFDLTATNFPLLSFWSRAEFSGPSLQLKVSTDYIGYGDPNNATWTDLNGRFPEVGTNVWTLSGNISLSAYKQAAVYIAWVYTSNDEEAARWTLDDVRIDNSLVPPPPTLTVNSELLNFSYTEAGSNSTRSFTYLANDIVSPVTLNTTTPFSLSKDGISYSNSIEYSVAEANNVTKTVYVRFTPTENGENYSGIVSVNTGGLKDTVNLKGSSIDPATTLDVVNWNIEWFGSASLGPSNDNQQEQNVVEIMTTLGADLYALGEIVSEARLQSVVSQLPGYDYAIGLFGSNGSTPAGIASAQKLAFVYNTSVFSNVSVRPMINAAQGSTSYTNWSSGRYPFLMTADVRINCVTKTMNFILIHAKANTDPIITSYNRRKAAAEELRDSINTYFADDYVVLLGDFNDDLDETITAGINPPVTSYVSFVNDGANFYSPTLPLSLQGEQSTVTHDNVIDHVVISNEVVPYYIESSASILTDVSSLVSNYGNSTSDHYPVLTRYQFEEPVTIPDVYALPSGVEANTVYIGYEPASSVTLTAEVEGPVAPYSYTWTPGSGTASSFTVSPTIETTYTVTVTDANGCTSSASKTIAVVDVRGGHKMDKVIICHKGNTQVVDGNSVAAHLKHGDMLGGCDLQSVTIVDNVLEEQGRFQVKAYPNPSSSSFKITMEGVDATAPVLIRVFDLQGRLVESKSRIGTLINIGEGYGQGVYLVEILNAKHVQHLKLVKTK